MNRKILIMILIILTMISSVLGVSYTNNGDGTGNYCWNNVPDARASRILDGFTESYGQKYFNESQLEAGLTNGQKLNVVFNSETVNFWNQHVYSYELNEAINTAIEAFKLSYQRPI